MDFREERELASFRGVSFRTSAAGEAAGRRIVRHDFPERDDPVLEDLGRRAREFTIEGHVVGDTYMAQRDRLLDALNAPGPGELIHQYRGKIRVSVVRARVRESTTEEGLARFTMTFVEHKEGLQPRGAENTTLGVLSQAGALNDAAQADFADNFNILQQAEFVVNAALKAISDGMQALEDVVEGVTGPVSAILRFPANAAGAVNGAFTRIRAQIANTKSAFRLFESMFNTGEDDPDPGTTTPSRKQQSINQTAVNNLLRNQAIAFAATAAMEIDYGGTSELLEVRAALLDGLDAQIEATGIEAAGVEAVSADGVFLTLSNLRAAIVKDFNARTQGLPPVVQFTPTRTTPSLVIAQSLYGDATREPEIITRNNIRRPLFVPGGVPLEVSLA